jgi:hypothetical protein
MLMENAGAVSVQLLLSVGRFEVAGVCRMTR